MPTPAPIRDLALPAPDGSGHSESPLGAGMILVHVTARVAPGKSAGPAPGDSPGRERPAGRIGAEISAEDARALAERCALQLLANLGAACGGDWDRVLRCVKLTVALDAAPDFRAHPAVADGASNLVAGALGAAGRHVRSAFGLAAPTPADALPATVRIDAVFALASFAP